MAVILSQPQSVKEVVMTCFVPTHYLKHYRLIVSWTLYSQLDSFEQISVKFESKSRILFSKRYIWKCHVQNGGLSVLTHWGWVTHICVSKLTIIVSDNGFSPGRRQTIIWTNAEILFIWTWGKNFSEILSEIHTLSFKKMHYKMSSEKWHQFCLCLNVLKIRCQTIQAFLIDFFHLNLTLSAFYFLCVCSKINILEI